MNILMFSWRGPNHPNAGGAEIVTFEHLKAWAAAGHNVTLFTSATPDLPRLERLDKVQIIRRGQQLVTVQLHALFWYVFGHHPKYDLVVDQFHGLPFFTPLFVPAKKLAFIHEVAKEVWWINHLRFPINYLFGAIGFFLEHLIFKLFYRRIPFFTVSQSTKDDLVNWFIPPSNIHIIPSGVITLPADFPKEKNPTVIFLGAVAKDKGIEDALFAFSLILKTNPQYQFWVVGKGEDKYLNSLRVPDNVKFWGFVNERHKFELLARAHVMLNPSVREGWGLVNIEANSVGTPVVAYDVPGCRDSIQDQVTGLLCPFKDIHCLAGSVQSLIENKSLYSRISTSAKSWSKQFTWAKSTPLSLALIDRIASNSKN